MTIVAAAQPPRPSASHRPRPSKRIAPDPASEPAPTPSPKRASLSGLTLLVVEDHADSRELLRRVLEPLGARVLLAENGYEALASLRREPRSPDVILCDLLMPAMDGLSFARRLQEEPEWRPIPIVAVTALGQLADYMMTWTQGFRAHLTKPVDPVVLANVVKGLVRHRAAGPSPPPDGPVAGR